MVLQVSFLWTTVIVFNLIQTVKIGNLYNFGQNINMVISSFTVAELLNLRGVVMTPKLPQQIYLRLKDLGLTTARPTRRGVRGGVHKQRTISTMLNHTPRTIVTAPASRGVVQANLVHIISAPAIPVLITGPEVKKWIKPRSADYNNLHVVGCRSEAKATSDQGLVKAMHLNVRSANNKAVRINEYVEEKDPDFLAMTETWIRFGNATINAMCPAGYRFIGKPRKERGGGVGFMYKSTFEVREDDKLLGDYKQWNISWL